MINKETLDIFEKLSILSDVEEHGIDEVLKYTFNKNRIDYINTLKEKSLGDFKNLRRILYNKLNKK